jgi:hypothetical protein
MGSWMDGGAINYEKDMKGKTGLVGRSKFDFELEVIIGHPDRALWSGVHIRKTKTEITMLYNFFIC